MKRNRKSLAIAFSVAALTLAIPAAANADEVVVLTVPGVGSWVIVNHEVCVSSGGQSVCHRWQTHEFRREQQREISRCTTINGVGDC